MHTQHFLKSTGLISLSLLLCSFGLPAQANTTRDSSGMNMGSEVVGGFRVDRADKPNVLSPDQQAASNLTVTTTNRAIAGLNQGNHTFAFPTRNGMATVVSLPTSGSDRLTTITLRLPAANGTFSRQQFTVTNPALGAELTSLFVLTDQAMQLDKKPKRDDLKIILAMYNNLVKSNSPEILVLLSGLPEFQAIRTQLNNLRDAASQP